MNINKAHINNFRIWLQNQELCHLEDMKQRVAKILDDLFDNQTDQTHELFNELQEIEQMYDHKIAYKKGQRPDEK